MMNMDGNISDIYHQSIIWQTSWSVHKNDYTIQGSYQFVKIKFNDFSRTFKDHTKDI